MPTVAPIIAQPASLLTGDARAALRLLAPSWFKVTAPDLLRASLRHRSPLNLYLRRVPNGAR